MKEGFGREAQRGLESKGERMAMLWWGAWQWRRTIVLGL